MFPLSPLPRSENNKRTVFRHRPMRQAGTAPGWGRSAGDGDPPGISPEPPGRSPDRSMLALAESEGGIGW